MVPKAPLKIHWDGRGLITRNTFLLDMLRTTLEVKNSTRKLKFDSTQVLPCALEELGFETTSFDPLAYIGDYTDNCVLSVLRTEKKDNLMKQGTKNLSRTDSIQQLSLSSFLEIFHKSTMECQRKFTQPALSHSV